MSLEQLIFLLLVLGLAGEEVEEVDDDADDHDDLHVEVLPVGPQVGGEVDNLIRLLLGLYAGLPCSPASCSSSAR